MYASWISDSWAWMSCSWVKSIDWTPLISVLLGCGMTPKVRLFRSPNRIIGWMGGWDLRHIPSEWAQWPVLSYFWWTYSYRSKAPKQHSTRPSSSNYNQQPDKPPSFHQISASKTCHDNAEPKPISAHLSPFFNYRLICNITMLFNSDSNVYKSRLYSYLVSIFVQFRGFKAVKASIIVSCLLVNNRHVFGVCICRGIGCRRWGSILIGSFLLYLPRM